MGYEVDPEEITEKYYEKFKQENEALFNPLKTVLGETIIKIVYQIAFTDGVLYQNETVKKELDKLCTKV